MSEPAIFALIRDGHTKYYGDRWASVFLHRELVWGPDELEAWVTERDELDEWTDECAAGVVVDFDRKRLVWSGEVESLQVPRVEAIFDRLLQAAWPGYEVVYAEAGMQDLADAIGIDEPCESYFERPESVRDAARMYEDEEPDEEDLDLGEFDDEEDEFDNEDDNEDEDDEEMKEGQFDEDEVRAWVTVVDVDGAIRHRHLERLPEDLLDADKGALQALADLRPAEVPHEAFVSEGMWIDEAKKSIGVWGTRSMRRELPEIQQNWKDWSVQWAEGGYEEQCQVSGPAGVPMGEAQALAKILPVILSTKRFDMASILGVFGGSLKKTAMKATGCLLCVICLPLIIFGLVSGYWTAVLISIGITCVVVIGVFKVIEYRFKKSFQKALPGTDEDDGLAPVAGPLDEKVRRRRVDQLLAQAELPGLAEVEPLFPETSELDLLD